MGPIQSLRLRTVVSILTGGYALALMLFLLLRVLFGDSRWWLAFFGNFTPFYFAALLILLPLALLLRARRGALLMLPLALIGLLWFGRLYVPRASASAIGIEERQTLRIVTFNSWGETSTEAPLRDWLKAVDADVVLMQEVPPAWARQEDDTFSDLYPYLANQPFEMRAWGNNTWSRYPIVATESFDLEGDGTPTHSRTVIDLNGELIAVYNIHLQVPMRETPRLRVPLLNHPYMNMVLKYDDSTRNGQIERLIGLLNDESLPYVVGGDFNMSDQTAIYHELAALMGDSFREAGVGLGTSWPTVEAIGLPSVIPPLVRIDYIWHSPSFEAAAAELGPSIGSDHLPLYAELAVRGES